MKIISLAFLPFLTGNSSGSPTKYGSYATMSQLAVWDSFDTVKQILHLYFDFSYRHLLHMISIIICWLWLTQVDVWSKYSYLIVSAIVGVPGYIQNLLPSVETYQPHQATTPILASKKWEAKWDFSRFRPLNGTCTHSTSSHTLCNYLNIHSKK